MIAGTIDAAPADWLAQSVPTYNTGPSSGGWFDGFGGVVKEAASTAAGLFGSALQVASTIDNYKFTQAQRQLELTKANANLDIQRTVTGAQVDIAKAQAASAIRSAQFSSAYGLNGQNDLSTILGNINARIAGIGGSGSIMLWLTVAGVGFAALQYFKGRK